MKTFILQIILFVGILASVALAQEVCDGTQTLECVEKVDQKTLFFNNQTECGARSDICCWDSLNNRCLQKQEYVPDKKSKGGETSAVFGEVGQLKELVRERSLSWGPPIPHCTTPPQFPRNCKITNNEPHVFDPPHNVPYCVRIPCSLDPARQRVFDNDIGQCGRQPGCYFDSALHEYRKGFGQAVMPGVPICQFAIRSKVFHREAKKVVDMLGEWNPYFTNCLLESFKDEIKKGPEGCNLLPMLDVFKIPAKMAGWSTINEYHCGLIDACYRRSKGCFYPVNLNDLVVKSNQFYKFNPREVVYGRPKCQHFDKRSPMTILKSYHQCLIAGCSVDTETITRYYEYLFEIGNDMTPQDQWKFWEEVNAGRIGAHNLDAIYWPRSKKGQVHTTAAPTTKNPFAFSNLPFFSGPKPSGSGIKFPSFGQDPGLQACGFAYRSTGGRPCPPRRLPVPMHRHGCPYKKVKVYKFPPLLGSTEGCCNVNPCYISTHDIRKMHSGPSYYYTQWSVFTPCSKSCGAGMQYRKRQCISTDKSKCTENLEDSRSCYTKCGVWSQWGSWEPCGFKCGVSSRYRKCLGGHKAVCVGDSQEVRQCGNPFICSR